MITLGDISSDEATSLSHTVAGLDRLLIVFVPRSSGSVGASGTISFNGVAMSDLEFLTGVGSATLRMVYMINPPVGTFTVSVGSPNGSVGIVAVSLEGVDTSNPFNSSGTNSATNFNNSNSLVCSLSSSISDSLMIAGVNISGSSPAGSASVASPSTQINSDSINTNLSLTATRSATTAGSYSVTFQRGSGTSRNIGACFAMINPKREVNNTGFFNLLNR